MREIKFRAKINGNWSYWTPSDSNDPHGSEFTWWEMFNAYGDKSTLGQFTGLKDKNCVEIYEGDVVNICEKKTFCNSDKCKENESIDISTKFCSNCGKEMKRQDFITVREIVFHKGTFCYRQYIDEDTVSSWPTYLAEIYIESVEVIGNIHDNPELIK